MACIYPSQSALLLDVRSRYSVCQAQFWVKRMQTSWLLPTAFSNGREGIDGAVRCFCLAKHRSPDWGLCGVETALPIDRCQPVTMNFPSHTDTHTHTEAHTPTASHLSKPGCGPWSCHTAGKRSPHMMCRRNAERGRNSSTLCTTVFSEKQVKLLHLIKCWKANLSDN